MKFQAITQTIISFLSILALGMGIYKYIKLKSELDSLRLQIGPSHTALDSGVLTPISSVDKGDIKNAASDGGMNDAISHGESEGKTASSYTSGTSKTPGSFKTGLPSDSSVPHSPGLPKDTPLGSHSDGQDNCSSSFTFNKKITETLNGPLEAPLGVISFTTNSKTPWSVSIFPREYKCEILDMTDKEGNFNRYLKMTLNSEGKEYELKITKAQTLTSHLSNEWSWNPRLGSSFFAGYGFGTRDFQYGGTIGLNLVSYGTNIENPDYYFLSLNLGYDINRSELNFIFYPGMINIRHFVPWTKSTYITIGSSFNTSGIGMVTGVNTLW